MKKILFSALTIGFVGFCQSAFGCEGYTCEQILSAGFVNGHHEQIQGWNSGIDPENSGQVNTDFSQSAIAAVSGERISGNFIGSAEVEAAQYGSYDEMFELPTGTAYHTGAGRQDFRLYGEVGGEHPIMDSVLNGSQNSLTTTNQSINETGASMLSNLRTESSVTATLDNSTVARFEAVNSHSYSNDMADGSWQIGTSTTKVSVSQGTFSE